MSHPKLIEVLVQQTPRSMIALLIVSSIYFVIFFKFIPLSFLIVWLFAQTILAYYRLYNVRMFNKHLKQASVHGIEKQKKVFMTLTALQACIWTASSCLVVIYAPPPFELVNLVIVIGIITAAVLSMATIYKAYMMFFFIMVIPQIFILFYYGKHQHIALVVLILIYIPVTLLLSKAIYNGHLINIQTNKKLQESVEELHKLSMIDNLTNIYNRRYFFEVAENLLSIAIREKKKASLLMMDIDFFKKINDTYGHHAGDFVLIGTVQEIEKIMRRSDIFARIGGEEFTILLHDTSIEGAKVIAEKIRSTIESKDFEYNELTIKLTLSIGISEVNQQNTSIENLYKEADKKLYSAKENGRNQIVS